MKHRILLVCLHALLAACSNTTPPIGDGNKPGIGPCSSSPDFDCSNTVNGVLLPMLAAEGVEPKLATDAELCRRYAIDLSGAAPLWAEYEEYCAGKTPAEMVDYFLAQPEYIKVNQRLWADAFQYDNGTAWYKYTSDLDAVVGKLYAGQLAYPDFAAIAVTHPAFLRKFTGENVIAYAFQAFLGRDALAEERQDLLGLYRPWVFRAAVDPALSLGHYAQICTPGPTACANSYICRKGLCTDAMMHSSTECAADSDCKTGSTCQDYCFESANYRPAFVDPSRCAGLGGLLCTSPMHEVALKLSGSVRSVDDLSPTDWEELRKPGRVVSTHPLFWEAGVDTVLHKYLGWWHGGFELPGYELAEVRQALAFFFQQHSGEVRALEREVLTSALYIMEAAHPDEDAKFWHYGPTKQMIAEAWLDSVSKFLGVPLGSCDWRFPNVLTRFLPPALRPAPGKVAGLSYRDEARMMGGCPDQIALFRYTDLGVLYTQEQRKVLGAACLDADATRFVAPAGANQQAFVTALYRDAFTRDPSAEELQGLLAQVPAIVPAAQGKTVARSLCQALLRSGRFLFY